MSFQNDLLNRYLQAVGQYLPAATKDDTLAELRANLLAQIEAREEETGRPLADADVSDILKAHGRPVLVAARYLPQRQLIGPIVFPFYWMTLRRAFPLVLLLYAIARSAEIVFRQDGNDLAGSILRAFLQLPSVLLTFWSVVTLVFAAIEYAQTRGAVANSWSAWEPNNLPPVSHEDGGESLATRVASVAVHFLFLLYALAVPTRPYLLLGPDGGYLDRISVGLSPEWHSVYLGIIALLVLQVIAKAGALFATTGRSQESVNLSTKLLGTAVAALLVAARLSFIPKSPAMDPHTLASINGALDLGFKVALLASLIDLVWHIARFFRGRMGSAYLALQ